MAKNTQRLPDNLFTGRCDADLGSSPLKQLDAQFVFQFSHGNTEGRLTDKTGLRRTTEMPLTRDSGNVSQLGKGHAAMIQANAGMKTKKAAD